VKRLIVGVIFCVAIVSIAYGQDVKDITPGAKERVTGVAKEKATAVVDDASITAEVKFKLSDAPSLKDAKIEVSTTGGGSESEGNREVQAGKRGCYQDCQGGERR